jgi:hypothetical protein
MNRVFIDKTGVPLGTYYLVGLLFVPILGIFLRGLYKQLVLGTPFGNNPASDSILIGVTIGVVVFTVGVFWLMVVLKTEIRIADQAISYRFPPFASKEKTYLITEIKHWEVVKRNRLLTGIGLRYDPINKSKIYSTGTKYYLSLEFNDDKKIMLSINNPEELKNIMQLAQSRDNE